MTKGKLISIEGIEGAGKSTVLAFIKDYLMSAGKEVILTREPGGTECAEKIRELILHTLLSENIQAETETLLMFASRKQHIKNTIEPALNSGKWVITDRYIDASYAYQGGGRGIAKEHIQYLDQWIVGDLYPDLTLLLDISPEQGFARTIKRGNHKDRIEQEKLAFFIQVREAYLARAKQYPERIMIIDAHLATEQVQDLIQNVLKRYIDLCT